MLKMTLRTLSIACLLVGAGVAVAALATGKADPSLAANIQQSIEAADRYLAYQQRKAEKAAKPTRK